jgi:hypothetical protein
MASIRRTNGPGVIASQKNSSLATSSSSSLRCSTSRQWSGGGYCSCLIILRLDNPERVLLFELVGGMKVHRPAGFVSNGLLPRMDSRSTYESVAPAVNKMLGAVVEQKLAFLLPLKTAQHYVPELHLCKAHWCTKKGKASGHPSGDLSYVDGTPLNTDETAVAATRHYGKIDNPTIDDIANMIYSFWADAQREKPNLRWTDLRIWKMDLKGAYTLLSYRPEDVGLFGMLLTGDLVYRQIAGIFGWAGTPAAFQVVTRVICSSTLMYVDDIIGVCSRTMSRRISP